MVTFVHVCYSQLVKKCFIYVGIFAKVISTFSFSFNYKGYQNFSRS